MSEGEILQLRERLARLEESAGNQERRLDIVQSDIRVIRSILDQMNGGKRAFLWICGAVGGVLAALAAVATAIRLLRS